MAVVVFVPSRIGGGDFIDLPAPTAGDDAKAITYNHGTGAFVYAAAGGGGAPPGSDTQVIFNDAGAYGADAGLTYAKATDRLTVVGGIVAPSMRPATNSTTALQWQKADGTAVVTADTTATAKVTVAGYLGIGATADRPFVLSSGQDNTFSANFVATHAGNAGLAGFKVSYISTDRGYMGYTGAASTSGLPAGVFIVGGAASTPTVLLAAATEFLRIATDGKIGIGTTTAVTRLDVADTNAGTGAVQNALTMRSTHASGAGTGFGVGFRAGLKSSTNVDQDAGRIIFKWGDATHATRSSIGQVSAFYITTEHFPITWGASSAGPLLSFGAVTTPIATPVLATGASATPDDIIAVLQSYGLVKQS